MSPYTESDCPLWQSTYPNTPQHKAAPNATHPQPTHAHAHAHAHTRTRTRAGCCERGLVKLLLLARTAMSKLKQPTRKGKGPFGPSAGESPALSGTDSSQTRGEAQGAAAATSTGLVGPTPRRQDLVGGKAGPNIRSHIRSPGTGQFLPFDDALIIARALKLKTAKQWVSAGCCLATCNAACTLPRGLPHSPLIADTHTFYRSRACESVHSCPFTCNTRVASHARRRSGARAANGRQTSRRHRTGRTSPTGGRSDR